MRYLFFVSVMATGLYALITGPSQVEMAVRADLPVEEKIRRMDELSASFSYRPQTFRLPASRAE